MNATFGAGPLAYLKWEVIKDMATGKAALGGGKERLNFDQRSAIPGRFVLQLADELAPSNIMDRLGQAVVLDQVLDAQTLDANRLVLANHAARELVLVVTTPIGNPCVDAGHFAPRFLAIARALFLFAQAPLCAGQLLLVACEEFGSGNGKRYCSCSSLLSSCTKDATKQ